MKIRTALLAETDPVEIRRGRERLLDYFGEGPFPAIQLSAAQAKELEAMNLHHQAQRLASSHPKPPKGTELALEYIGGEHVLCERQVSSPAPLAGVAQLTLAEAAARLGLHPADATLLLGVGNTFTVVEVEAAAALGWRP